MVYDGCGRVVMGGDDWLRFLVDEGDARRVLGSVL